MDPCSGFWCPHAEQNQPRSRTREQKAPLPAPLMKTQKLAHPAARPLKTTPVTKLQVLRRARPTWALLMSFNCERAQPANLGAVLAESGKCACWESHVSTSHESQLSPRRYHERCARGRRAWALPARVQRPCQRCIACVPNRRDRWHCTPHRDNRWWRRPIVCYSTTNRGRPSLEGAFAISASSSPSRGSSVVGFALANV